MRKVGIYGVSGYVGAELARLLASHPEVSLAKATSREHTGSPISSVHPSLAKVAEVTITSHEERFEECDIVFLAAKHTESMKKAAQLSVLPCFQEGRQRLIDLSADFRLPAPQFERIYGVPHACPELIEAAVYANPELDPGPISSARLISNPGCFAHCVTLGNAPILDFLRTSAQLPQKLEIQVTAVTGSTGSGATPAPRAHHPERNDSLSAYEVLTHRHIPEIERALSQFTGHKSKITVRLVPVSGPFSRGIFATSFVGGDFSLTGLANHVKEFCAARTFLRYRENSPRLIDVRGSNFCDLHVAAQGGTIVAISALDNLVKGAAGNAIQCMNLMCGLSPHLGLMASPLYP